jgi:hypothetical protein
MRSRRRGRDAVYECASEIVYTEGMEGTYDDDVRGQPVVSEEEPCVTGEAEPGECTTCGDGVSRVWAHREQSVPGDGEYPCVDGGHGDELQKCHEDED